MEQYHSTKTYKAEVPQAENAPFIYEYRSSSTEDFIPYTKIEGDRFAPSDCDSSVFGYQWVMGFSVGENTLARTFVAPRSGLVCVDFLDGIRYWLADMEASGIQVWHNQTLLFPQTGIYPDDLCPVTTKEFLLLPKFYRVVEEGDKIRFLVRSLKPNNKDDVCSEVEVTYLFGGALTHRLILAPGKTASIPTYTTEGVVRFISRDPSTIAVGADGTVLGLSEGSGIVQLVFADGSEDWVEVLVSNTPDIAENPYLITVEESRTNRSPGGGIGVSEEDTLQLCIRLGQAVISHGDRLADATRYDRPGSGVKLLQNDVLSDQVEATFLDSYRGGRTLTDMCLTFCTEQDTHYAVRLWFSTTKAPQQFNYLTTIQNQLPVIPGRYITLKLTPQERVEDVHTLRAQFLRTEGSGIKFMEWDASLADESNELLALRNEQRQSFWLPEIFADGMMFQHQKPIRVFGYSKSEGATLTVGLTDAEGRTHATTAVVTDGKFVAEFPAQEATDKGLTLTVSGLGQTAVFRDIWVGELWIAAGQSNMGIGANWLRDQGFVEEFESMKAMIDETKPIRMFAQLPNAGDHPCRDTVDGHWMANTVQNALAYSAVGYFSVLKMQEKLGIPMGIISTHLAGTWIQSWVDEDFFDGSQESDRLYLNWHYREKLGKESWCRPMAPYYGMVCPIAGFNVGGVIWYQGTNNAGQRWKFYNYGPQLEKFIRLWRKVFLDEDLPFVVIQALSELCYSVPGLDEVVKGGMDNAAAVTEMYHLFREAKPKEPNENMIGFVTMREHQSHVEATVENVLCVVTYDITDKRYAVHPPNKLPLALRVGEQVLGAFYGVEGLRHSPTFKSVTKTADGLLLTFNYADGGLVVKDGNPIRHFEVSRDGYQFEDAEVTLTEEGLFIPAPDARYVRHAFESCPEVNVYNQEGYPLEPFRAGVSEGRIWEGEFTVKISG